MPKVILKRKAEVIAEISLLRKKKISVGSSRDNDIVISDKNISEHHCTIEIKDGTYELKDNNTLTGTKVNGRSVTIFELRPGNIISLGTHSLTIRPESGRQGQKTTDSGLSDGPKMYLLGIYGKYEGKKYEIIQGDTYIGREDSNPRGMVNDIALKEDMTVSKGHAKINCAAEKCTLTDIGSTGGVAVNGIKVGQLNDITISSGDEIAIGRTIFRFVIGDTADYSSSKKYGVFMMKMQRLISFVALFGILGVSVFYIYKGISGLSTLSASPAKLNIDFMQGWSADGNMPHEALVPYDVTSSPAMADINRDGTVDVVSVNATGKLYAWDGKNGRSLWDSVDIQAPGSASPVISDMNNDGFQDITVVSGNSMIYVIDGQSGVVVYKDMLGGTIKDLSPAVADLNLDGRNDIVVCSEEGSVYFIYSPGFETQTEKYTDTVEAPVYASPVIVATRKISPLAVISSYNSKVYIIDGRNREKKTIDLSERTGKAHLLAAAPGVGDLNGDGTPDIVVQSTLPQYISAIDISQFDVKWTYFVDPVPPGGLKHNASPVVTDVTGDGLGDVVAVSANGTVYALKGKTGYPAGELLWKLEVPESGRMLSSPALYDFNKNGSLDIAFAGESGTIYLVETGNDKRGNRLLAMTRASNSSITSSLSIGDADGDGLLEFAISDVTDSVHLLKTNARVFKNRVPWPMFLSGPGRTGMPADTESKQPFAIMLISGIAAALTALAVKFLAKKKVLMKRPKVVYL